MARMEPVRGSSTIALALFAAHLRTVARSTSSAFAWMPWSSVRKRSRPGTSRRCPTTAITRPAGSLTTVCLQAERAFHGECRRTRVGDLLRIRIDGRRPLAQRQLNAGAVEDRSPPRGHRDHLAMLGATESGERLRPHPLKPRRAEEQAG